jgi:ABC-2 type transport system ATP-binding protein
MIQEHPRPVVVVDRISKSYPTGFWRKRVRVLSELSFSVASNEIVGFLGPNGAGKTTTIKILNRLADPDSGVVTLFGEEAGKRPETRRRIGFMPEQPYFYEYLTGQEFLSLCGHLNSMGRSDIRERSRSILSKVGLDGTGGTAIRKYSKGMMQRLGLAQALLHDPELVILDEPMSGLDPMGRMEVRNIIRELKSSGKTVFFSSHILSDVEALCDRVVMLHRGRKVAEGTVEDLVGKGGVRYVEIVFSPVPSTEWLSTAGLPEDSVTIQGSSLLFRATDHDQANEWIERFRSTGSQLRSCMPVKRHLEDIYVERMEKGDREGNVGTEDTETGARDGGTGGERAG